MHVFTWLAALVLASAVAAAAATEAPSRPGVDAPELAHLGKFAVGVRTLELVNHGWPNLNGPLVAGAAVPRRDRHIVVDVWYPAHAAPRARPTQYSGALETETPGRLQAFSVPGIAFRDARPAGGGFPLVVVSHGRSNVTAALTWLTENLASKC
jgi:predicted dienelactone hydrolase